MKTEWRPTNWVNPFSNEDRPLLIDDRQGMIFEAGASAMLAAVIKWLDEPCDKHENELLNTYGEVVAITPYSHRKDCPQCMASLREVGQ